MLVDEETRKRILADMEEEAPKDFEVDEECWDAVQVFLGCVTQWKFAEFAGVRRGLDYSALEVVIRNYEVEDPYECFRDVQVIELAALQSIAEAKKKNG